MQWFKRKKRNFLLKTYLTERKQIVNFEEFFSTYDVGVPQGLVIVPVLFQIWTNDLQKYQFKGSKFFSSFTQLLNKTHKTVTILILNLKLFQAGSL